MIPEIDTPGHVWAGFAAIDGLLTTCYDADGTVAGTGPINPAREVQGLPHHLGPHLTSISALHHLSRAVRCALLGGHAD